MEDQSFIILLIDSQGLRSCEKFNSRGQALTAIRALGATFKVRGFLTAQPEGGTSLKARQGPARIKIGS
jgi:hypothetical protein